MKLINFVLFLSALICSSRAYADQCSYSAYVDFGPAMNGGYIDKKELVYRTSGLIKNMVALRGYLIFPYGCNFTKVSGRY